MQAGARSRLCAVELAKLPPFAAAKSAAAAQAPTLLHSLRAGIIADIVGGAPSDSDISGSSVPSSAVPSPPTARSSVCGSTGSGAPRHQRRSPRAGTASPPALASPLRSHNRDFALAVPLERAHAWSRDILAAAETQPAHAKALLRNGGAADGGAADGGASDEADNDRENRGERSPPSGKRAVSDRSNGVVGSAAHTLLS